MSIKYLGESGTEKIINTLASCRGICNTQLDELSEIIKDLSSLIEDMNEIVNNIELLDSSSSSEEIEEQSSSDSSSSIGEEEIGFIVTWEKNEAETTEISGDASVFLNSWRPVLVDTSENTDTTLTPSWLMRNNWLRYMSSSTAEIYDSDDSNVGEFAPTIGITEDDAYDFENYDLYVMTSSVTNDDDITASEFYVEYISKSIEELWNNDKTLIQNEIENKTSGTSYDNPLPEYPTQIYVGVDTSNILNGETISLYDGVEISISSYLVLSRCTYLGHDVYFDVEFDLCIVVTTTIDEVETENVMMSIIYDTNNILKYNSEKDYYYYADDIIINSSDGKGELYKISYDNNIVYIDNDSGDYFAAYDAYYKNNQLFTDKDGNLMYYYDEQNNATEYTDIYGFTVIYDSDNDIYTLEDYPDFQVPEKYINKTTNGYYKYYDDSDDSFITDESDVAPVYIFRKLKTDTDNYHTIDSNENYLQERILIPVSHIMRPWETTSTNYTIGVASTRDQYIIDEYLYRGINLEEIDTNSHENYILNAGTAICPGPPFSNSSGALRNFFFTYNIGGVNSSGGNGIYDGINTFNGSSEYENRNHARLELLSDINSDSEYNWQTLAQANNSDSSSTSPFSVMGYHPLNAIITGCEALYGTKNPYSSGLFGHGLDYRKYDSTDENSDDVSYCKTGGIWWKITQVTDSSSSSVIDSDWEKDDMGLSGDVSTIEDESIIDFATNRYSACMTVPMEAQMALSFAMETGIPAETFFTFYGNVYCWSNVNDSGSYGPENGYFNARICKVLSDEWYYSRSYETAVAINLMATADVIFFLRYSLYLGIDIAGENPRNCDNGITITVSDAESTEATLSKFVLELNPSDSNSEIISLESGTLKADDFDQRYNFTPIPYDYGYDIFEGYAWALTGESKEYTGTLYVGGRGMPRSVSIFDVDTPSDSSGNSLTFGSLQFMVDT